MLLLDTYRIVKAFGQRRNQSLKPPYDCNLQQDAMICLACKGLSYKQL